MQYKNPLILTLSKYPSFRSQNTDSFNINIAQPWGKFKNDIQSAIRQRGDFDYIAINYNNRLFEDPDVSLRSLNIMSNEISRVGTTYNVPVINRYQGQVYQLNMAFNDGQRYMPNNEVVIGKYEQYNPDSTNNDAWQKHQAEVWGKFAEISPLLDGSWKKGPNHKSILMAPSRGLEEKDLDEFFSIVPNQTIIPSLMGDDMVGMPGINAKKNQDEYYYKDKLIGRGAMALSTIGSGYAIPMRNKNGDMAKFQIGADVSVYNVGIKARAADGVSIQKSEIRDKKTRVYKFELNDGTPSGLIVVEANNDSVVFEDAKGQFEVGIKDDIKNLLIERDYKISEFIDSMKVLPEAKYNWPAPGNMVGVYDKVNKYDVPQLVSPSEAGFIPVREPKTPDKGYTLLVVEGALKGKIVATYLGKENMQNLTDDIARDGNGLIVAQVPGVIRKFIESTKNIMSTYDITDSVVAMDADGRYNRSVAQGIHDAENILGECGETRVMSWNPEQKGLDDALIALNRNEITKDDFGLAFGSANELFPLDQASAPNPYKLNGKRVNRVDGKLEWQIEDSQKQTERSKIVDEIQNNSKVLDETLDQPFENELIENEPLFGIDENETVNIVEPEPILVDNVLDNKSTKIDEKPHGEDGHSLGSESTVVKEKSKVTLPPIHHVKSEDIEKIVNRVNDGELTEEDVIDFFNSVSDMTHEIQNAVTNFANNQ